MIVSAWAEGLFTPCVSNALLYEYVEVFSSKFSDEGWRYTEPIFAALLTRAAFVPIDYSWRPSVPDAGDEHVVDCVMNARAVLVTHNLKDFRDAARQLRFEVMKAPAFAQRLAGDAQ